MIANSYFLGSLLSPLAGGADDDSLDHYLKVDLNEEIAAKKIIQKEFYDYFINRSTEYKDAARFSLSYYLTTNSVNFESILDSCVLPFRIPKDSRQFFLWLWEVPFHEENYKMENFKDVKASEDFKDYSNFMDMFGRIMR